MVLCTVCIFAYLDLKVCLCVPWDIVPEQLSCHDLFHMFIYGDEKNTTVMSNNGILENDL